LIELDELIKLAEKIGDKSLRNKVINLLKDLKLSNKFFAKYEPEKIERAGSMFAVSSSSLGPVERDVVNHTVALTELCIEAAKLFREKYKLELNEDFLIAAAILHDLMKCFEYKRDENGELEPTGVMLDHTMLAVAELYTRDFPEEVIHIVASHFGEGGPTSPRSFEALTLHYLDTLVSLIEYYHKGKLQLEKQIEMLKKMKGVEKD
jgi:7,8-dihydroneopterin 2',3'-cyclic phosphate phosphodiesterase